MDGGESFSRENTTHQYSDEDPSNNNDEDGIQSEYREEGEYGEYDPYADPYAGRRGRYKDENDDLGIYYDDEDLRLANEEGTYLVAVRVPLDRFGNRLDVEYGPDGKPKKRAAGALSLKSYHLRAERELVAPPAYNNEESAYWSEAAPERIDNTFTLNGGKGKEDEGDRARRMRLRTVSQSEGLGPSSPIREQGSSPLREQHSLSVKPVGGMRLLNKQPVVQPKKSPPKASSKSSNKKDKSPSKSSSSKKELSLEESSSMNMSSSKGGGKFAAALARSARRSGGGDALPVRSPEGGSVPPPQNLHPPSPTKATSKVVSTTLEWKGGGHGGGASKVAPKVSSDTNGRVVGTAFAHNVLRGRKLDLVQPSEPDAPSSPQQTSGPQLLGGQADPLGWDESVPQHLRDARRRQLVAQAARRRQDGEGTDDTPLNEEDTNQNGGDAKQLLDSEDAKRRRQGPTAHRTCETAWFTFSGEPCDILSYRSLIASNDEDPVPDRQGPFPAELLAMVLLFIPAHSRREMVGISSVCRFWRFHSNYGPQWTRFRLNTWVGGYPKPVAAKLKQRKIMTRAELFEERRRAVEESHYETVTACASLWGKEGLVLLLVVVMLLLSWGIATGLGHATTGLNTDGKLGSTLFFVFTVLALIQFGVLRLVAHIWFDNTDRIAGAGIYARAMQVAADGSGVSLTGPGGASGLVEGSKALQTLPWILIVFNVASAVVIGLLWGRVLSSRIVSDAGLFNVPDILSPASYVGGVPITTLSEDPPGFVRLPAALADPRWMILNTSLVYANNVTSTPNTTFRNNTDFLDIQRVTLLWFDEGRVSPLFSQSAAAAIPTWWNSTYGACSLTPDTDPFTGKTNDIDTLCQSNNNVNSAVNMRTAVSLLLRVVGTDAPLGLNPFISQQPAGACADVSDTKDGITDGGVVVAVVGGGSSYLSTVLGDIPRNPYTYRTTIQRTQSSLPTAYTAAGEAYRGVLATNYFGTDLGGLQKRWYNTESTSVTGVWSLASGSKIDRLLSPWSAQRCINDTNTRLGIPLIRLDKTGSVQQFSDKADRLFNAHLAVVFSALSVLVLVFLLTMCIPNDFVHVLGGTIYVACLILLSPATLLIFGVVCIVSGKDVDGGGGGFTIQSDEVAMCDADAGAGMVATGCVIGFVVLVIFIKKTCADRF